MTVLHFPDRKPVDNAAVDAHAVSELKRSRRGHAPRRVEDRRLWSRETLCYYYRAVIDGSNHAIVALSAEGEIQLWNSAAEQLFGYSEDEVKGRSVGFLKPAQPQEEEREPDWHTALRGRWRGLRRCNDGSLVDVLILWSPLPAARHAKSGVVWHVFHIA